MTYGLVGSLTTTPGRRDDLVALLLRAAELLEDNAGCLQYLVGTGDDPDTVWVSELWTDRAAHDSSLEPEAVQVVIAEARPLIAGMAEPTQLDVRGGKGMPR
jgi:quinol monooxygenase YgiN